LKLRLTFFVVFLNLAAPVSAEFVYMSTALCIALAFD